MISKFIARLLIGAAMWLAFAPRASVFCQTVQSPSQNQPKGQFNLLVLGDSILWGQGLKDEHKSWYLVKTWLTQNTLREVREKIEAHSGALIEGSSGPESAAPVDGEINVAEPSVSEQVDRAQRYFGDGSKVDLVLVSCCVNDVGAQNLLNAAAATGEIAGLTEEKCGLPVERLLRKITSSFPNTNVIVTGYYPMFSEKTKKDFFMKAWAKRLFKAKLGDPRVSSQEILKRLIANSKAWYQTSNRSIAGVVAKINSELENQGLRRRLRFAEINFLPEYSFGGAETRLWGFSKSPARRLAVISTLGKVPLETNDERRNERTRSCDQFFKEKTNETEEQKKTREIRRLLCHFAALGHPNRKGALLYADAITGELKSMIMK
jgi:lysophospholipase L1-like esterase